jgi:DUF1009 family protein
MAAGAPKLGLIAGGGELPVRLVETCRAAGRDLFVVALEGHADAGLAAAGAPLCWHRLGAVGAILDALRDAGVAEVVLAGRVRRPSLAELRPDWRGARLLAQVGARALGDDGLLRAVVGALEAEGLRAVGVQEIVADLLTPPGPLGRLAPDALAESDIARGVEVAQGLGRLDVGQAVVVQEGIILGVEAAEGTDALIVRCASLKREGPGPVLVKVRKPQQDVRLDLPAIGTDTVAAAAAAGLRGLAVEAGGTLTLGRDRVAAAADAAGLFVAGIAVGPS